MGEYIDFRYVKAHADFDPVLEHYGIETEGNGDEQSALCPFHDERKPSFKVNLVKNVFNCFGCGAHGNVLEFVAKMEECELREAAKKLASYCAISLSDRSGGRSGGNGARRSAEETPEGSSEGDDTRKKTKRTRRRRSAKEEASPDEGANKPLTFTLELDAEHPYLEERGINPETIEHFQLGFCGRGMMKNRVCIPIHDERGELVAYAGRWAGDDVPEGEEKYLLPPKFAKSKVLFNLNRLMVMEVEHVVVVEGYFGAMRLHMLHVPVVAVMGTSISDEQVALLVSAGIKRAIVLMDGDGAGVDAAERVVPALAGCLWVRKALLPEGEDPETVDEGELLELVPAVNEAGAERAPPVCRL